MKNLVEKLKLLLTKENLACLGASNIFFITHWHETGNRPWDWGVLYFYAIREPLHYFITWFTVIAIAVFLRVLLKYATQKEHPKASLAAKVGLLFCSYKIANELRYYFQYQLELPHIGLRNVLSAMGTVGAIVFLLVIGAGALYALRRLWNHIPAIFCGIFILTFPFSVYTMGRSFVRFARGDFYHHEFQTLAPLSDHRAGPPVVIHIFDEWDYETAFERLANTFPEMEALKNESVWMTQAISVTNSTNTAIPSYLTGKVITWTSGVSPDTLLVSEDNEKNAVDLRKTPHLFSIARKSGYRSSIVGYHHPYCRLFGEYLETCETVRSIVYQRFSFQYKDYFARLFGRLSFEGDLGALSFSEFLLHKTVEYYKEMAESKADFLYGHFPIPHGPLVGTNPRFLPQYKPPHKSYRVNLAWADYVMGEMKQSLKKQSRWDDSVVIFTTDHWFREKRPRSKDYRIPVFIKFPHQTEGLKYEKKFSAAHLYEILAKTFQGDLKSPSDLVALLDTYDDENVEPIFTSDFGTPTTQKIEGPETEEGEES